MLFHKQPEIYDLIDEFAAWKLTVNPYKAGAERSLLIRLARSMKLTSVEEMTEEQIAFFVAGELTGFYTEAALRAIRSFLWYSRHAGYECLPPSIVAKLKRGLNKERERVMLVRPVSNWKPGIIGRFKRSY